MSGTKADPIIINDDNEDLVDAVDSDDEETDVDTIVASPIRDEAETSELEDILRHSDGRYWMIPPQESEDGLDLIIDMEPSFK